ncbi:N-acetylneuraminate synthase [Flavobacteriaceae bacterium UJ101]|nr:N-acetylneuraminate synthase [Flavobacteriaceae bacterium UJ101]
MSDKVFIIAELSANHGGDINIAKETIRAAKRAGADAIKMQTYTPDTMTLNSSKDDFIVQGGTIWDGKNLYELYEEASLPWEWHKELFDEAKREGLICFSTPFDLTAVDFLEDLDCPIYKIASFEITDIPLLKYVASKGKPVIISTGIADYNDIKLAVETCREEGCTDITLLKCTSSYPAPIEEANLMMIKQFGKDFNVKVGLSDHTLGSLIPVLSVAMGARVIEKHFILNKEIGGPDASFSMDEKEFTDMVEKVRQAESALGKVTYDLTSKQISGKRFSRSLYVSKNISKGDYISHDNVRSVRPGFGLPPKYLEVIIGKKVKKDLFLGDRLQKEDIDYDF